MGKDMKQLARASAVALAVSIALSAAVSSAAPLPGPNLTSLSWKAPDAIIGGDTDAIIGGDLLSAIPPDLLIWGPIESVDPVKKTVVVLGQRLKANAANAFLHDLQTDLRTGNVCSVAVSGRLKPNGQLDSATMRILDKPYAAGSDLVFITGRISSVDMSLGKVAIGKVEIDYSQLLSAGILHVDVGDLLVVAGTQPVLLGTVYAQAVRVVSQAK